MIIEKYYDGNEVEMEIREEIKKLIKDYSFKNNEKIKEMLSINWTEA